MTRRVPRKPRPKKVNVPKGYDSMWEYDIHQTLLKDWKHHWDTIKYVVHHKYEADFVREFSGKIILIEAKGRFWDYAEYSKYIHIREALPKYMELVFREDKILNEIKSYIGNTYDQHYANGKYQATDMILDAGHGEGFCLGNIMKYAMRYGKKNGKNTADLLKIIHYAIIALYLQEDNND